MMQFSWTNEDIVPKTMNFRVRLYASARRTEPPAFTFYTGISQVGWTANGGAFPPAGAVVATGATVALALTPAGLTQGVLYYGLIDSYDGLEWTDPADVDAADYVTTESGSYQITGAALEYLETLTWPAIGEVQKGVPFVNLSGATEGDLTGVVDDEGNHHPNVGLSRDEVEDGVPYYDETGLHHGRAEKPAVAPPGVGVPALW